MRGGAAWSREDANPGVSILVQGPCPRLTGCWERCDADEIRDSPTGDRQLKRPLFLRATYLLQP